MTHTAPNYLAMSPRDLAKTVEVQQQVILDLQEAITWRDELLSNAQLPIAARIAAYATRKFREDPRRKPDKDGYYKAYLPAMAETVGVSASTISRGLELLAEATTAIEKRTEHEYDEIGNKKSLTYLRTLDSFKTPAQIVPTKEIKKHGGDHRLASCNGCGSTVIVEQKVQVCADCGTVYKEFAPRLVNGTDVPETLEDDPPLQDATTNGDPQETPPLQDATADGDGKLLEIPPLQDATAQVMNEETGNDREPLQDATGPVLPAEPLQNATLYVVNKAIASCNGSPIPITPPHLLQRLGPWLEKRIGDARIIRATGKLETAQKYIYEPASYLPDLAGYIAGDREHIYGSRPLRADGTTYVLGFDNDDEDYDQQRLEDIMTTLARAGASSLCWMRRPGRWHLEVYFDTPVDARAAYAWCIAICPELAEIRECYPVKTAHEDKRHNALSWPLYYRIGRQVIACSVEGMLAELPGELIEHAGIRDTNDLRRLVDLIGLAVTPAALIPPSTPPDPDPKPAAPTASTRGGGLLENSPRPLWSGPATGEDVRAIVLAESNAALTWEEVAGLCGGLDDQGRFKAIWRGERTASVKVDRDGRYACDYGNHGSYPRKLDKFGAWCLAKGIDVKAEITRRCAEYRERHAVRPAPAREITFL